jgi:predicted transcriptional regulator of viral defense system
MKYSDLTKMLGKQGIFDLATLVQLTGDRRETIRMQLSRWCTSGKLISLRRGMYAFPETGSSTPINPAVMANKLYSPSYISTYWMLGFYGLIPEKVVTYTCVTQRTTRSFSNPFGTFKYQHIKGNAFFGYRFHEMSGEKVLVAEPEKALLDLWHLTKGTWDENRMAAMRFQNKRVVNHETLQRYAERYQSPRLIKATALWISMIDDEEGATEL